MSLRNISWLLAVLAFVGAGCGDEEVPRVNQDSFHGAGGDSGNLGAGGSPGTGGIPGTGGSPGTGGDGGSADLCGNGTADWGEDCDGADLRGSSCIDFDFNGGELGCSFDCTWDTSACIQVEVCDDGADNDGDGDVDCEDSDCFDDLEACPRCGDGVINGDDACDGEAIPTTCENEGFSHGTARCTDACELDLSGCVPLEICDDGIDNDGDGDTDCDDAACLGAFECPVCGNGILQQGEACDDSNLADDDGCSSTCEFEPWLVAQEIGGTSVRHGSIDGTEPLFVRTTACDSLTDRGEMHFDVHYLLNDGDGAVRVRVEAVYGDPASLFIYSPSFHPANTQANCLAGYEIPSAPYETSHSLALPPRSGVYVVATSYDDAAAIGPYALTARTMGVCGDGVVSGDEQCDFGDTEVGDGCSSSCQIESGWVCDDTTCWQPVCGDGLREGDEQCDDDNTIDGDGCSSTCRLEGGTSCADAINLNDFPAAAAVTWELHGTTADRSSNFSASCNWTSDSPDMFLRFTPPVTAFYRFVFHSRMDGVLSGLSSDCTELWCLDWNISGQPEGTFIELEQGEPLIFVLDAWSSAPLTEGDFTFSVVQLFCGDGSVNPLEEECDDGNTVDGDGCDATCQLELTEVEPNDSLATATPYSIPAKGSLPVASDVDYWSFPVTAGLTYLVHTATGLSGECGVRDLETDTLLTILDDTGSFVDENDDTTPDFWCSKLTFTAATSGTYYAVVESGSRLAGTGSTIPHYFLWVKEL